MIRGECGKSTWYFALAFLGFYKLIVWCRLEEVGTQKAGKKRTILLSMELQGGTKLDQASDVTAWPGADSFNFGDLDEEFRPWIFQTIWSRNVSGIDSFA